MKKPVKIIGGIILALLAAGGVGISMTAPLVAETTTLSKATAKLTFTEQGIYLYDRNMTVFSQISGEVLDVKVKKGDTVKKGDIIAVISASDYEYQIKGLESTITGYQAQINNLSVQEQENKNSLYSSRENLLGQIAVLDAALKQNETNEKSLEKQLEFQMNIIEQNRGLIGILRSDYRTAREDYDDGYITEPEYNAARAAYNQAQNALEVSLQQYEQLKNGVADKEGTKAQRDSLEAQLGLVDSRIGQNGAWAMQQYYNAMIDVTKQNIESMQDKLGQASITASADGVIDALPIGDANLISQGSAAATISSDPMIEVYVPIREIDGVHTGDTVELVISSRMGDKILSGKVTEIKDEAEVKISALGVEERKVRVLIRPDDEKPGLGYEMDVKFTLFEQPDVITVPKTSVFEKDGKDMVWAVDNGTAALREVVKGIETRDGFTITEGLSAGDIIITDANTEGVKEGKRIKM